MKTVAFSDVPVGDWFKESEAGAWHLKTGLNKAMYQSFGTRYEPCFAATDTVFMD